MFKKQTSDYKQSNMKKNMLLLMLILVGLSCYSQTNAITVGDAIASKFISYGFVDVSQQVSQSGGYLTYKRVPTEFSMTYRTERMSVRSVISLVNNVVIYWNDIVEETQWENESLGSTLILSRIYSVTGPQSNFAVKFYVLDLDTSGVLLNISVKPYSR